jgi:hypothetical protein
MPKGKGPPVRSKDKFPQDLTGGNIGSRLKAPDKKGNGPPTRSNERFPQDLTGGNIGNRHKPPG